MKFCKNCKRTRNDRCFYIRKKNKKPYGNCKECQFFLSTERFRNYKKDAVEYLGGKCVLCSYNKCYAALDFHHKNPKEKAFNYSSMRNWSFERKKKELDKCLLLCSNCHREVTVGITKIDNILGE